MIDYEKAKWLLFIMTRIKPSAEVVFLQPGDILKKCRNSGELDFYYRKLSGKETRI